MTTHELAKKLLEGPDGVACVLDTDSDCYGIVDWLIPSFVKLTEDRRKIIDWRLNPAEGFEPAIEIDARVFEDPMGLMKRIHTELHAGNGRTLNRLPPAERAGWQSLVDADKAEQFAKKAFAANNGPDGGIESIGMEIRYTGSKPTVIGQYLVVDVLTGSRRSAIVGEMPGGRRGVRVDSDQMRPLEESLKPTQRWFLIPKLSKEDLTLVRELPIS